jgi:hypothetical protein
MKHTKCPRCHHRNDYRKRSGPSRPHRCADLPAVHASGKSVRSIKVVGKKRVA